MITKDQKIEIFENTLLGLRKKFILSDKNRLDVRGRVDRLSKKFRRLPLD